MDRDALNDWVVKKMNSRGWSMRELARQIDADHSYISKVLSGKQEAKIDFYFRIAQAFDAVPEMMEMADIMPTEDALRGSLLELFKAVMKLDVDQQKHFIEYGRFLVQQDKQQNEAAGNNDLATDGG